VIVWIVYSRLSNFSATRRLQNYRWQGCKFIHSMLSTYDYQQSGLFYVHYLLRHGALVYTVLLLADICVPQWDWTFNVRTNRSLPHRYNHCAMQASYIIPDENTKALYTCTVSALTDAAEPPHNTVDIYPKNCAAFKITFHDVFTISNSKFPMQ
jgi:hypothetical protein